jgi:hypothetical protein
MRLTALLFDPPRRTPHPQSQQTHQCWCSSPTTLNCCPCQALLRVPTNKPALQTKLTMSLQGCIVYLLLTYGAHAHKAHSSDLVYLVTRNPFTPLFGHKWAHIATLHSSSHQGMTQASDQLHTTSFYSPPVLGKPHNTHNTRNTQSLSLLVHV